MHPIRQKHLKTSFIQSSPYGHLQLLQIPVQTKIIILRRIIYFLPSFNHMITKEMLEMAKRIQAISQIGLTYNTKGFDIERYSELEQISHRIVELLTGQPVEAIKDFYLGAKEYPTPKTDVRAIIFNEKDEILMVREKIDGKWTPPGGWADIGHTPREVAVKEAEEETGLIVEPKRLLAVLDKKMHDHPPQLEYVYKMFIGCEVKGGQLTQAHDMHDVAYFPRHEIPPLSSDRITAAQIELMFEYHFHPGKEVIFD